MKGFIILILIIFGVVLIRYDPKPDLIESGEYISVIIWYNKYYNGIVKRDYIIIYSKKT